MNEQTDKPNPPRYPFIVVSPTGPLKDDDDNIKGYRTKAAAEAARAIAQEAADLPYTLTIDKIPMADNIKIQGEE